MINISEGQRPTAKGLLFKKSFKTQTVSKEEFLGKPEVKKGHKNKDIKGIQSSCHIKHGSIPNQIKTNPHIKNHLFHFLLSDILEIQQHKRHIKKQEKIYNSEEMIQ